MFRGSVAAFAASILALGTASTSHAANLFFDADGLSLGGNLNGITELGGTYSWTPGTTQFFINPLTGPTTEIAGVAADTFQFGGNGQTMFSGATVNVSTGTIGGLIFGATGGSGYTLSASSPAQALTIGTSGIVVNAGSFATSVGSANLGITLGGAQSWANSSANPLTISGAITNGTSLLTLQAQSAGDVNVVGTITGGTSGGITVNSSGSGRVILSGNNTQTGTTTLTAGILRATTSANALGTGTLQLNGGTLQLANDTALNFGRNTTVGGNTTIISDRLTAGAGVTQTLGTLSLGAFTLTNNAGAFVNATGTTGLTFGTTTITGAGTINTNNSFFASGITNLTTLASLSRSTQNLVIGGTGNTTITGGDTGTTGTLTKNGAGTLTLGTAAGAATFASSGLLTINGGTINVTPSTTFSNATKPALTFGGTGQFTFNSTATAGAAAQSMGGLTNTAGEGTVSSVFTTGVTSTSLTFSNLVARSAGATTNFSYTGGTFAGATPTNKIVLTQIGGVAAPLGFINQGTFVNGTDYAYYDNVNGYVRAPVIGTDAGFTTVAGGTTLGAGAILANNIQTTAAVTAQTAASVNTLKISSGSAANFTQTTGTALTLGGNGILRTGGSTTIFGSTTATAATLTGTGELVIRTDTANDAITFNGTNAMVITGFVGLTKTGAGTLNMANVPNTFTGNININGGTLSVVGATDPTGLGAAGARNITLNGGTFQLLTTSWDIAASTKSLIVGPAGGTFNVGAGLTLTMNDAGQLSGGGNLTFNGNSTGILQLGSSTVNENGFTGNLFVTSGTLKLLNVLGAGGSIVMTPNASAYDVQNGNTNIVSTPIFVGGTGISSGGAIISSATGGTLSGTVTMTADTTINTANGIVLSGSLTDAGRGFVLTKTGASFLTLNGANTYSGGTVMASSSSQLALGNSGALGTGPLTVNTALTGTQVVASVNTVMANSVNLNSDTTFSVFANGNNGNMTFGALNLGTGVRTISVGVPSVTTTFTGPITGGSGLTMGGLGTLALSGTGSFTGPVTVNSGGTLSVGSTALNAVTSVTVGTTTTSGLNFNADNVGKAINLAANTTVTLGGATSQALLGFQLGNTSNYDSLNLSGATGNLTVGTAGALISVNSLTGFGPAANTTDTYNLITTSGGGTISGFANIALNSGALPTGYNYVLTNSSTSSVLAVSAGSAGNLFWRGDLNGSWNGGAGTGNTNWNDAADTTDNLFTPNPTNTAVFSSAGLAGATPVSTTLDQNFAVAGIVVNNTNTGNLTINQGTFGALTIGTGGITVNTGGPTSTTINAPIVLNGTQTWAVTDVSQTLSIQGGTPANGTITGAGATIIKTGAGALTLGGFNTNNFGINLNNGTLNINNGGSTTANSALGTGTLTINGGSIDNTSIAPQSVLSNTSVTLATNLNFTGTKSLNLGTGAVALGASSRTVTVTSGTLQLGGIISSAASVGLIKTGTGTLTLGGANTFSTAGSSGLTLNDGKVNINAAAALGVGTLVINNTGSGVTIDNTTGATLTATNAQTWSTGFTYGGSSPLIMSGAVNAGGLAKTVTVNGPGLGINTNSLTIGGDITKNTTALTKAGPGALLLTNANASFASGGLNLTGGTLGINVINALGAAGNTLTISANTALDTLAAGIVNTNANAMAWNGNFAFLGTGNLTMPGAITSVSGVNLTSVANTLTLSGAISNTNTPALTFNGGGTVALSGNNLYTGTTTVNYGTTLNLGNAGANGSLNGTSGTTLVLNGGVFNYTRTGTATQNMAGVTIGPGRSVILNSTTSQTMALGAITRNVAGGTLDIRPFAGSIISTSSTNDASGILGGWAVINSGASWAVGNGAAVVSPFTAFTTTTTAGTTAASYSGLNIDVDNNAGLIGGTIAPNSIRFNSATGFTMTLAAGINTIGSGGILVTPTAAGGTSIITGGTITGSAGPNGDLIINHYGTTGLLHINSVIADEPTVGSVTALTKSGFITAAQSIASIGGSLGSGLGGSIVNTFTGGVYLDMGELRVNGSSVAGGNGATGPLNQNAIFLNGNATNTVLNLLLDGDATGTANAIDLTGADATKSGVTVNNSSAIQVGRLGQGTVLSAAAPTMFTTSLNKTVQFGPLSFGNAGRTLTITPNNGYGVEFIGTTTLDQNLTTINVGGTATASNVVQAMALTGQVTGTIPGGSWAKAGTGTLALNNAANNFVSNIVVTGGILAFNSDGALGNPANTITLNGGAGSGIRAFGGTDSVIVTSSSTSSTAVTVANPARLFVGYSLLGSTITAINGTSVTLAANASQTITSATSVSSALTIGTNRTINLWNATVANNVIEVAANTTLQLNTAFGGANSPFTKADLGTLVLNADNGLWAGQISIAAGAVRVTNSGGLGISTSATVGNTVVAATGGALQLQGVSIWEQLNLTGTGISSSGALQAVGTSATSTTNGLITLAAAATIGADSTNTLNIRGGMTGAFGVTFAGAGNINVDTTGLGTLNAITKLNSGTTTLTVASPTFVGAITVNAGTLAFGGAQGGGAGSVGGTGAIAINPGGILTVDNSVGIGVNNRLGGAAATVRPIAIAGGAFNYIGNANSPSLETLGALTFNTRGESTITVTAGANAGAGLLFGSVGRTAGTGGTALFRGSNLGSAPSNGVATIGFNTTGITFVGGTGAAGTITKGLLPWALVDASVSGTGTSFATADTATGNLRALAASEYVTNLGGFVTSGPNIALGSAQTLASSATANSLTLNGSSGVTINPLQTLTVSSGGILATAAANIGGGLLTTGSAADLIFHANANMTLDSVIVGSSGGNAPYLTKTGAGTLTLNKGTAFIGQTAINQGTLKLAGGNNTLFYSSGNSFLSMNGGTLDLNGNSQLVFGLFSDSTVTGGGGSIIGGAGSTLVTNSDARNWAGTIDGSVAFQRGGSASATTMYSDNTYTGATLISGGTMVLQDSGRISGSTSIGIDYGAELRIENTAGTQNQGDRVNNAAPLTLRGGIITFNGRAATNSSELLGPVTLSKGISRIGMGVTSGTVASSELTVTDLVRATGQGTIMFNLQGGTTLGTIGTGQRVYLQQINGVSTSTLGSGLINNIIGPWAVSQDSGNTDWASYNPTLGVGKLGQAGYAGYSNIGAAATTSTIANAGVNDNVNIDVGIGSSVLAADKTVGTLRLGNFTIGTIDINTGKTLTLGNGISGGLLHFSNTATSIGTAANTGTLTSGGSELFFFTQGSATLTVNSVIAGTGMKLIKSGSTGTVGALILAGTNTYDGGTELNLAPVSVAATGSLGTGGITLNGAALTQVSGGIIPAQTVIFNGPSTLTLASSGNLLGNLSFNVDGGAQTGPALAIGANALTLTGNITAGGSNPNATALISGAGGLNLNANNSFGIAVNAFSFNSQNVAPNAVPLSITTVVSNGGITKTGNGLLSLGGANTFAGGVDVQNGGLVLAVSSIGAITSGPVGTGTLLISGATTTLTANAAGGISVANPVTLANTATTLNLGNLGAGTLTLSGPISWSTATGLARTVNVNATTTGGVSFATQTLSGIITSSGTGNGIVKTGIGNLALTANNASTLDWTGANAVTVNNGLLQIGADTALGMVPTSAQADNIILNGGGISATASFTLASNRGINVGDAGTTGAGVVDVGAGFALAYAGIISNNGAGTGGLIKSGTGTLALTGVSTYSGSTTLAGGSTSANSSSALGDGSATNALIFSGGTLQATGTITSPATRPVSLVNNATIDTNGNSVSLAGVISGAANSGSLTKIGSGTLTLSGANTFTGATTISNGTLTLDYTAQNNSKLSDTGSLSLAGVTLNLVGGTHNETVGSTFLSTGATTVTSTSGGLLNLNTITRDAIGTINFTTSGIATTDTLNTTAGILGPWATINGTDWAFNSTNLADGLITAYAGYTDVTRQVSGTKTITSLTTTNVRIVEGTGGSPASITFAATGTTDINTLLQSSSGGTGAATIDPGTTDILRLGAAGGILMDPTAGALTLGTVANDGFLTAGGNTIANNPSTLTLTNNSANNLTVNSAISNNGTGAINLIMNGTGNFNLAGTNTYSGNTQIDAGTVTISGVGTLGATTNALTMNGGKLNLGATTQTTGAVSITAPAASGNTIQNGTLTGTSYAVSNTAGNVIIASNLGANAATLTKTNNGTLTLSGNYGHTGATTVNGGTLQFAGTSTGTSTITANNAGSVIQIGSSTGLTASNPVSITTGTTFDLNGFSVSIGALTSVAASTITNTSAGTGASTATSLNTPSGLGVYVDALNTATGLGTLASLIADGATRKTQITVNNANGNAVFSNTANTFSGGLVLLNNVTGTRLSPGNIVGTPYGTGPIIIGQAATDKAGIYFANATTFNNPIVFNTALGTDRVGIRADAAVNLSGMITANLAPATFTSNNATAGAFTLTGQVTGASGLVLDITSLAAAATTFNVTLNNSGTANDYAGDTVVNLAAATGKSANLNLGAANQIPNGTGKGNVVLNTNGTGVGLLNLAGFSDTINGLNGNGTVDGTTGTPTLTVGDGNATGAFSGIIKNTSGSLTLAKIGSGTQTLSGPSTFSGPVNVTGGLIAFATSPVTSGPLGNSTVVNISNNGGISYTGAGSNALNRPLAIGASNGVVDVLTGTGILTMSGANVTSAGGNLVKTGPGLALISGTTTLNAGAAGVAVNGGTLQGSFGTGGIATLNIGAAGNMSFQNSAIEALTLGNASGALTLAGGARIGLEIDGATNDSITIGATGTAVSAGTIIFDFFNTGAGVTSGNTYNLLSSTLGGLTSGGASYVIGTAPIGFNYSITQTDTLVQVGVVTFSPKYWRGATDSSWNTLGTNPNLNWSTDTAGAMDATAVPGSGDTVIFSATNAVATGGAISTTLDSNFTIFSLQGISAPTSPATTSVTINPGTGTSLTIQPTSIGTGIDIGANAGAFTIGADLIASSVGAPTQTWTVDGTGASSLAINGIVTFNANVIKNGAGSLTLGNAANTGTTAFAFNAGTLNFNGVGALPTGALTFGAGTTINNTGSAGTLTNSSYTWKGDLTLPGAALTLNTGNVSVTGNIVETNTNALTVAGNISNDGTNRNFTKAGSGTTTLNGANNWGGTTTVNSGTLTLGGATTFGGLVSVNGTSTLNLNGNNTGAGGVTLAAGTFLNINNNGALGTGRLTLNGGTIDSPNAARTTTNNNVQTWTNAATVIFTGTNTLNLGTGDVTLGTDATVGSFTLTNNSALSGTSLTVGGNISAIAGGTAGVKTLTIAGAGSTALTGNLTKGASSNLAVTVTSGGTTTLSGAASSIQTININGGASSIIELGTGNLTITNGGTNGFRASAGGTINGTGGGSIILGSGGADNLDNGTADGTTLTVNAKISGGFGFEIYGGAVTNTGVTVLTAQNNFTGNVFINGGNLSVSNIGNTGSITSNLGQGTIIQSGSAVLSGGNTVTTGKLIYTGAGETTNRILTMAGAGFAIEQAAVSGNLLFSQNVSVTNTAAKTLFLLGSTAGTGELGGLIPNNTAATSVTKLGSGKWTLSGLSATAASNYTGTTTINDGTLALSTTSPTLTGGLTFGAAAGSTTAGTLDLSSVASSTTFTGTALVQTKTATNIITLGTKTLTLNGGLTLGYDLGSGSGGNPSNLTVTGAGTMAINGTNINISVNQAAINAAYYSSATLDVNALASFSTNVTNFNIGVGTTTTGNGTVLLSNTANTILATTLSIGDTGGNNGNGTSTLTLGTGSNIIQADTIRIARSKGTGNTLIAFASQASGSPGTVTITNKAGSGAAIIEVANTSTATAGGPTGTLDLRGHIATVDASTLIIGQTSATSNIASTNGTVGFDAGSFTVGTLTMGLKTAASTGTATGTLNIGGGSFTVNTAFTLGSQATAGTSVAALNLTGGTFTSNVAIAQGGGSTTSTINLDGTPAATTLDLTNHAIGSATNLITLNAKQGTLQNLSQLNGGGNLTKTTAGTLILSGTNAYTGKTIVQEGTVSFSSGNVSATANQPLGANTALDLGLASSFSGRLLFTGGNDTLAKNINILGNGNDTIENNGGDILTLSGTINANGTTVTLKNTNANSQINVSGTITGVSANSNVVIDGGTTTLSGANSYTGSTNLTGGTLLLGIDNVLPNGAAFTLSGGTKLGTGGNDANTGALTLGGSAIIDMGNASSILSFTDISAWTGVLSVWNWTGTTRTAGGTDQLIFTGSTTPINLANVNFYSDGGSTLLGGGGAVFDGTELVPVPEPGAVLAGLMLLGVIGYRERRRRL